MSRTEVFCFRLNFNISKLLKQSQPLPPTAAILGWKHIRSFTRWHLWRQNTIPSIQRNHLAGNQYFVPLPVFYTQSAVDRPHLVRSPRFIPESVFYTQSVLRLTPCFIPSPQSAVRSTQSAVHVLYWQSCTRKVSLYRFPLWTLPIDQQYWIKLISLLSQPEVSTSKTGNAVFWSTKNRFFCRLKGTRETKHTHNVFWVAIAQISHIQYNWVHLRRPSN